MKALFEVGEEVILVSKDCPELNGDAVVISIAPVGLSNCPHCGERLKRSEGIAYYLNVKSKVKQKCCSPWCESCLRKKYKGSDFSFDEMMKEIKSKKPIEV